MSLSTAEIAILDVIDKSDGHWHLKDIDYAYWSHADSADLDLLKTIRQLVCSGHLHAGHVDGTSRSWVLTELGRSVLEAHRPRT